MVIRIIHGGVTSYFRIMNFVEALELIIIKTTDIQTFAQQGSLN